MVAHAKSWTQLFVSYCRGQIKNTIGETQQTSQLGKIKFERTLKVSQRTVNIRL